MKKSFYSSFLLVTGLFFSSASFAVTEEESQLLSEVASDLGFLIEKAMKAKSFSRADDIERVKYDLLIMDLKEVKLTIELAAASDKSQRRVKNLNLNYTDGL